MARHSAMRLLSLNLLHNQTYRQDLYGFCQMGTRLSSTFVQTNKKQFGMIKSKGRNPTTLFPVNGLQFHKFPTCSYSYGKNICSSFHTEPRRQFFTAIGTKFISLGPYSNGVKSEKKTKIDLSHYKPCLSSYSTKGTHLDKDILNHPSALLVKRSSRKKIPKIHDEGKTRQLNNVVAYAVGEDIELEALKKILIKQGLYSIGELPTDVNNALHVRGKYNVDKRPKEIFVFDDGSVVFWCVPEIERGTFLKVLMKYCESPYSRSVVLAEREELDFNYVQVQTSLKDDIIQLKEREVDETEWMLELYAFSNAMAQAVKLSIWEASLETFITSIESVTEDVRHGRKLKVSRRQLLKKSGELMSLRHLINLSSDLLDTPDFYWDRAHLEPLYQNLCGQLEIAKRTKVINEKLTHCCELVDLVSHHLSDEHHIRLEVMIIILILVEVVFEFLHFARDHYEFKAKETVLADEETDSVSSKDKNQ